MSGHIVIALRKMDSFSSISCCEDPREAEAKERRLERRKRGIFRREHRRAMSQDSSAPSIDNTRKSPSSRRGRKKEKVQRTVSTPHDKNSPLPVTDAPVERLSPRRHSCCDPKERWGNRAKKTPDRAPPRCMRKVSMQHGTDCSDNSEDSITIEGDGTIVSGLSRWESDPASTGQDSSLHKIKIRRSKTWSHSGDNESCDTCHLSLFTPPRLPRRKNSDQNSLEELVNALSRRRNMER
jgi:hypothetical protein